MSFLPQTAQPDIYLLSSSQLSPPPPIFDRGRDTRATNPQVHPLHLYDADERGNVRRCVPLFRVTNWILIMGTLTYKTSRRHKRSVQVKGHRILAHRQQLRFDGMHVYAGCVQELGLCHRDTSYEYCFTRATCFR